MEVYMTSPVLIDVILLAALLFFVLMGAKRGFILTLCSLVAVVVALVGANLAADTLSPKVADAIRPRLEQAIQESLEEKALEVGMSAADMDVLAVLKEKGGLYEWAADAVGDVLHSSDLIPSAASIAARVWEATVAQAAPATPHWNFATNSRSSPTLARIDTPSASRAARVSPAERRDEELRLYAKHASRPPKITRR